MSRFCKHPHRIHALGGGQFVCFACWLRTVLGVSPSSSDPKGEP